MEIFGSTLFRGLLGFASTMILLAILVQIIQEIFKYLTKSKPRAYKKALVDFLGPWALQLFRLDLSPNLLARGPFQMRRLRPKGVLLPLEKQQLISRLEATAPSWIKRTLEALKQEARLQEDGTSKPSPIWHEFLQNIGKVKKGDIGYWNAREVFNWLKTWGHHFEETNEGGDIGKINSPSELNARELLKSFRQKFLSHVENAEEYFPQLKNNFEYTYRRRNLRLTFTFALIIALLFNFSAERIFLNATKLSPEESIALAESSIQAYQELEKEGADAVVLKDKLDSAKKILDKSLVSISEEKTIERYFVSGEDIIPPGKKPITSILKYLFGCLLTAVLVSFGAPFWNDLAKSLLRIQKAKSQNQTN